MNEDEARLFEKLRKIEALYAGATTEGERAAAEYVRQQLLFRLAEFEREDPPAEYKFTMSNLWSRRLLAALLRRYDIEPYRYHRQRYTTVMARVSRRFVDETLWPEFQALNEVMVDYMDGVADRIIAGVLESDSSEPAVVDEPPALPERSVGAVPPAAEPSSESPQSEPSASSRKGRERRQKKKRKGKRRR
jgi:hypothetical protein